MHAPGDEQLGLRWPDDFRGSCSEITREPLTMRGDLGVRLCQDQVHGNRHDGGAPDRPDRFGCRGARHKPVRRRADESDATLGEGTPDGPIVNREGEPVQALLVGRTAEVLDARADSKLLQAGEHLERCRQRVVARVRNEHGGLARTG